MYNRLCEQVTSTDRLITAFSMIGTRQSTHLLVQFSVTVLMAVRFQLSCILVRQTAKRVSASTPSYQITYATLCG